MRNSARSILILILIGLSYYSCRKVHYFKDDLVGFDSSRCLVHRGGRDDTLPENSYEGCIDALPMMDGVEVDVQMSKDRTVWLSHSFMVENCGQELNCFVETSDDEIESIKNCDDNANSYCKLEDVFKYMDDNNIRKYIVIDMKEWGPCSIRTLDVFSLMNLEAEKIIALGEKYHLIPYLLFEAELPEPLKHAKKKNQGISTYLTSYGDYDIGIIRALEHDCDGVSFKTNFREDLNEEKMNLLHKKGLRLLAWNVPDSSHLEYLKSIDADFILWDLK